MVNHHTHTYRLCQMDDHEDQWQWAKLRHDTETLSALMVVCEGNPPASGGYTSQRFVDVNIQRLLNKHTTCWLI